MAGLSSIGFVLIAFGEMSFSMRLREMEKLYEKNVKEQTLIQSEPSIPLAYKNEIIFKDRVSLYKDKYFFINLFDKIMYEVTRELKS